MLAPDVRGEQARAHREHPTFPAREEKVGAEFFSRRAAQYPIPGQHEEIGGDDGDVECVEVAHGLVGSRRY